MTAPREVKVPLSELYEADETAWLEESARLVAQRRFEELDVEHLSEYLADMAKRDRREVLSRLTVLLAHLLKWDRQPERRSNSWRATIAMQRDELGDLLESGTLRRHAEEVLERAYARAVRQAALETGAPAESFPPGCPYSLDQALEAE
jgi:hypothetical protein